MNSEPQFSRRSQHCERGLALKLHFGQAKVLHDVLNHTMAVVGGNEIELMYAMPMSSAGTSSEDLRARIPGP